MPKQLPPSRQPARLLGIYLRGLAMGAADIIPGVSGGTIALILGIYRELIEALRSLSGPGFLRSLLGLRFGQAFREANGAFLAALAAGIVSAAFGLSHLLGFLLESRQELVYAFFFGLILASVWAVGRRVDRWRAGSITLFLVGAIGAFVLVGLAPASTPDTPVFLFGSGAVAVSALLLPGISGAFVLVLLGKYAFVLDAIRSLDLGALAIVGSGMVFGLLSFARFLGWLFRRFHDTTLALLCGLMLGSLRRIWPWKMGMGEGLVNAPPPLHLPFDPQAGPVWVLILAATGALAVAVMEGLDRSERAASD